MGLHWTKWFAFVAVFSLLSGCFGISQPTDKQIEAMSSNYFNQQFQGLFLADEVIKNNGYKQNDTHYVAEVTVKATAQRSIDEYAKALMHDQTISAMDKIAQSMAIGIWKMTLPEFQQGDQLEFERNYLFIKTDNGWQLKRELEANDQDKI